METVSITEDDMSISELSHKIKDGKIQFSKSPTAFLCSHPKMGRTYSIFLLGHYFKAFYDLKLPELDLHTIHKIIPISDNRTGDGFPGYFFYGYDEVPFIICYHGSYHEVLNGKKKIFLLRNICDAVVSWYYHKNKEAAEQGKTLFSSDVHEFIRNTGQSISPLASHLNTYADKLDDALVLSFESLVLDPKESLKKMLLYLDIPIRDDFLDHSVNKSMFKNLKKIEEKYNLKKSIENDASLRRFRRGKIQGYKDELTEQEIYFIKEVWGKLLSKNAMSLYSKYVGVDL